MFGNGEQTSEILHHVSVCKSIATDFAPERWRRANEWDGMCYKVSTKIQICVARGNEELPKTRKSHRGGWLFREGLQWSGGECTTKLPFLSKTRGKVLCIRVFGSMCFEPIRSASALGEQRHAHAVGTFHFFDHKAANGVEFAVGNGEIEFVVHLQDHFCV